MIYENRYGRLEIEEASEELRISQLLYKKAPDCSKYSIDNLEKISVISSGAINTSLRYPDPRQGFIYRYTGPTTAVYLKVISLYWDTNFNLIQASEDLANQRSLKCTK